MLAYFPTLMFTDPIVTEFNDGTFRAHCSFTYSEAIKRKGKFFIKLSLNNNLFDFQYAFKIPNTFLETKNKNDLYIKTKLCQSLMSHKPQKILQYQTLVSNISVTGSRMLLIKKQFIQLLVDLVENNNIFPQMEIVLKSGKEIEVEIPNLTTKMLTKRIEFLVFYEKF
jgi:hypothetical protein